MRGGIFGATVLAFVLGLGGAPVWAQAGQAPAASAASPAREYREALAVGDATRAAGAAMRMWRGRLDEDGLRRLNTRLKVTSDDQSVAAVVLEVARLRKSAEPAAGGSAAGATAASASAAPEPNGTRLLNWLASNYRPPQGAQQAAPVAPAAAAPSPEPAKAARPAVRIAVKPPVRQKQREPSTAENPALAYETALLARDTDGMARAVAQLTREPVTAETVRKLNAEIGVEPDDSLVQAVVEAAPAKRGARTARAGRAE